MNTLYFSVGVSIILALLVALVGPFFIDWTAYRAAFEREVEKILGQPVVVAGALDATLLPRPRFLVTHLVMGEDAKAPLATVERLTAEVELFPLLSGEIRVTRMEMARPLFQLHVREDGAFAFDAAPVIGVEPAKIAFERIEVVDGRLTLIDARRPGPVEVADIDAALEARSLNGPYKFDGTLTVGGEPVAVRLATGEYRTGEPLAFKMEALPQRRALSLALDGLVALREGQPEFQGEARLEERPPAAAQEEAPSWSVTAELDLNSLRARARAIDIRHGPAETSITLNGAATLDFSATPMVQAVLSTRQIDLDRILGAGPGTPLAFPSLLQRLAERLKALPRPALAGEIGLDIGGVVAGGGLVQNVRLDLSTAPEGWRIENFSAGLPGGGEIKGSSGRLSLSPDMRLEAFLALRSEQPVTLLHWLWPGGTPPALAPFSGRARMTLTETGLRLDDMAASMGSTTMTGNLRALAAQAGRNRSIELMLDAPSVAAEQITALADFISNKEMTWAATDVLLRLSAARLTSPQAVAEGVEMSASLKEGTLDLERLAVRDLAGARLFASGSVRDVATAPDGSLQLQFTAEKLEGTLALLAAWLPDEGWIAQRARTASLLAPANLQVSITAARVGEDSNAALNVSGMAGETRIESRINFAGRIDRWREAALDVEARFESSDAVKMLRQGGVEALDTGAPEQGRLSLLLHGVPMEGLATKVEGGFGRTRFLLDGTSTLKKDKPLSAALAAELAAPDAGPLLALGGHVMADVLAGTPVALKAAMAVEGNEIRLNTLRGRVADQEVAGDLTLVLAGEVPKLRGALDLDEGTLADLLELALGPGTLMFPLIESRNPWPETPFGGAFLDALEMDIALAIKRMAVKEGISLDEVSLSLRSSPAETHFDAITAHLAGGTLTGLLTIKRDLEGQAAIAGTIKADRLAAEALAWRRNDRPVVTGQFSLDADFNASGRTLAGLVATLAGGGTLRLADGTLRFMNPEAFTAVIAALDAGQILDDEKISGLFTAQVDAGDLAYENVEGAFTVASGILRVPSLVATARGGLTTGSATIDLPRQRLESDWTFALAAADRAAAGVTPPQVGILFRGPLWAPERRIDITAFSSFLGIRAFERETERVLTLQADIVEREILSRMVMRMEEADARLARKRAAEEAARRAAEEAALRAEEEGLTDDDSPPEGQESLPGEEDPIGARLDELELMPRETPSPLPDLPGVELGPAFPPGAPLPPLPRGIDIGPPP